MNTFGVVLAAGQSSRMPNKALLPLADNMIAVESALAFMKGWVGPTTVLHGPSEILTKVLLLRGHKVATMVQEEPTGVADAISLAVRGLPPDSRVVVTFCDNVYDRQEALSAKGWLYTDTEGGCYASVHPNAKDPRRQLDFHSGTRWCDRSELIMEDRRQYFGGWLIAPTLVFAAFNGSSLVPLLNAYEFQPVQCHGPWHDIGTADSYERYLDSL